MDAATLRLPHVLLILATIAGGLLLDTQTGPVGQMLLSAGVWGVLFYLLAGLGRVERFPFIACLLIATLGELVLSLAWGLYTYRLGNVPLFVPPGHVLLFLLGLALAQRLSEAAALAVIGAAAAYSLAAALLGLDTFGLVLFALLAAAALVMPRQRRLYASTFMIALGLELYGTWLGNWTWAPDVPFLALTTTNPPVTAGAFYSALDALIAMAMGFFMQRQGVAQACSPARANERP